MAGVFAARLLVAMAVLATELLCIALVGLRLIDTPACLLFSGSSSKSNVAESGAPNWTEFCEGRKIFVYDLPSEFNADLARRCDKINPWTSMCPALSNSGLGPRISDTNAGSSNLLLWFEPWLWRWKNRDRAGYQDWESSWYTTDQFTGEVIFHDRMLRYECRTHDPDDATAFFVPYYAGLDVSRYLWEPGSGDVDRLGQLLLEWLDSASPYFRRRGGLDHFLVAGRITWDFRRLPHRRGEWGSSLFHSTAMANVTRLVIERNPWDDRDLAVPYPTGFHPSSSPALESWRRRVRASKREALFAFAGSPRPDYPNDFRHFLLEQCKAAPACRWLSCEKQESKASVAGCGADPLAATKLFLGSTFCLQPRGDSFTRRSTFDAIIAGCIPVFFWDQSAYWQYQLYLPADPDAYSVFIPHSIARNASFSIAAALAAVPPQAVAAKQAALLDLIPKLLYAGPAADGWSWSSSRGFKDAFDVAIEGVLDRVAASAVASSTLD